MSPPVPGRAPAAPGLTLRPDPDRFAELAKGHRIVPVWTEVVADTLTPVAAFLAAVVGDGPGFLWSRSRAASGGAATRSSAGRRWPP